MTTFAIIIAVILIFVVIILLTRRSGPYIPEERIAGMKGEMIADSIISQVLDKDDLLFTNVEISYDGKDTELDNVVVIDTPHG